jgi:hypothetical protein
MIILDGANGDILELVTSSTANIHSSVHYVDTGADTPKLAAAAIATAATTTLLTGSGIGQFCVKSGYWANIDAAVANIVKVRVKKSGTSYVMYTVALNAGDSLIYEDDEGFRVLDTNGNEKAIFNLPTGAANLVYATPDGASGAPTLRALVANDIPSLNASKIAAGLLALARGGNNADLSAAGPGVLKQTANGAAVSTALLLTSDMDVTNNGGVVNQWENFLDNPMGKVAQRPTGALSTSFSYGAIDRWKALVTGTTPSGTLTQDTNASLGGTYAIKGTITLTTSGTFVLRQFIEKKNAVRLASKTVIFSANFFQNIGATITVKFNIYPMTADDNGTAGTPYTTAAAQNLATGFGGGGLNSGGVTLDALAAHGLIVEIVFTISTSAAAATIEFNNAQLQLGSTVTPIQERTYQEELSRCQRYYNQIYDTVANEFHFAAGMVVSTTQAQFIYDFPVPMFKAPSISVHAASDFNLVSNTNVGIAVTTMGFDILGTRSARINVNYGAVASMVAGSATLLLRSGSPAGSFMAFDADF